MGAPAGLVRNGAPSTSCQLRSAGMRVPVRVRLQKLVDEMDDQVFEQAANVATLPGIVAPASCMPDGHWGYGFPIGGVAAMIRAAAA